jgi:hypothetical protein
MAAALLLLQSSPAQARSSITPLEGRPGHYEIELVQEPVDVFLDRLASKLSIEVQRRGEQSPAMLNGRFRGPLSSLLPRVLGQENILLFHGDDREATDGVSKLLVLRTVTGGSPAIVRAPPPASSPQPEALALPIPPAAPAPGNEGGAAPSAPPPTQPGWPNGTGRIVKQGMPPPSAANPAIRSNAAPVTPGSAPTTQNGALDESYRARAISSFYGNAEPPPKPLEEMTEAERDAYLVEQSRLRLDGLHLQLQAACKARGTC